MFKLILPSLYLLIAVALASGQNEGLILRSECVCPGYDLIYECTVKGQTGGATVWQGTAFDCLSNEITLLHSRFGDGIFGVCNDGAIVGKSIGAENGCFTSQLTIKLSATMIGENIVCINDDTINSESEVGSTRIITTKVPYPPPEKLSVTHADLGSRQLIFSWSPVAPDCPAIHYNILASNCGSCPTTTIHTTVTCTNVPTDGSTCTLAVRTVVCENTIGNFSDSVQGTLKGGSSCTGAIASLSLFAILLAVCLIVLTILITILVKNKGNIKFYEVKLSRFKKASSVTESTYEDVRQRQQSIDTKKNIAYGKPLNTSISVTVTSKQ